MEPFAIVALGLVLGVRHATDPDHVVAVTAIAARYRKIAPAAPVAYLAVFALGTILGMTLITLGLAALVKLAGAKWPGLGAPLRVATGTLSLLFGVYVLWHVGWIDGLFGAAPAWSPQ